MKKALIIGGAGFVGGYLSRYLKEDCGFEVAITTIEPEPGNDNSGIRKIPLDILDTKTLEPALTEYAPDYIFHLAAISSVAVSWKDPGQVIDVNIKGSINVLNAVRALPYKPRILLIGSGEEYGHILKDEVPIQEDNRLRPGNIYAASKACQNMIGKIYADAYQMDIVMVRAFNHIGPGQSTQFVAADFCRQIADIEKGIRKPVMCVGNLSARRDFTDVRDVVKAYNLLIQQGKAGETYNVGSGKAIPVEELLSVLLSISSADIDVKVDAERLRPVDVPVIEADISKIKVDTGWEPRIPLKETLEATLNYWRKQ